MSFWLGFTSHLNVFDVQIYMPTESMCSKINILRIMTNVTAVAISVFSTTFVPIKASFAALSAMMRTATILQLSLISKSELRDAFKAVYFWIDHLTPLFLRFSVF